MTRMLLSERTKNATITCSKCANDRCAVCPYCGSSSLTGRCNGYFCLSCMHFIDIDEVTE